MIEDVLEDEDINVWRDEHFYHLHMMDRGILIDFTEDGWIGFLSSMKKIFYKENVND